MWILNKSGRLIVNTNRIKSIKVIDDCLLADGVEIDEFNTEDEAKKELKQIYDALISGQESYSVG